MSPSTTRPGTAVGDVLALVVGQPRRDLAELDRERAAEAAAGLGLRHLLEHEAGHLGEQRARLRLDAHLAQSGAGVVVGDGPVEAPRNLVELQHVRRGSRSARRSSQRAPRARRRARDRRRGARRSGCGSSRCRTPTARPRSRSPRTRQSTLAASALASARSPELYAGCPQQVCPGGTNTSAPPASSSLIAAKPTDGRIRSTRQVTKRPTRMVMLPGITRHVSTRMLRSGPRAARAAPARSEEAGLRQRDDAQPHQRLRQDAEGAAARGRWPTAAPGCRRAARSARRRPARRSTSA